MKNKVYELKDILYVAIAAALIVVCSWITVPSAVPFTLQVFAVFFVLEFIGGKRGTAAYFVYIALGSLGVPVFSGMRGGIGHLFNATGGYLLGLVVSCIVFWFSEKKVRKNLAFHIAVLAIGLFACYLCGTVWFVMVTGHTVSHSLMLCVVPFILPDVLKITLAFLIDGRMRKIIKV